MLLPFLKQFWYALCRSAPFEEAWLNQWNTANRSIYQQIATASLQQKLKVPSSFGHKTLSGFSPTQLGRCYLMTSFIHMTNNRLGIFNHDEGYVAYLINSGLKDALL